MINTKQKSATINQLKKISVVKPNHLGNRWVGIQHGELVQSIHAELDSRGIKVVGEGWYPSGKDLGKLSGSMRLDIPGLEAVPGTAFSLGVQHSNTGEHALKFAVGAQIFICENGMVVGDYAVKRRHTLNVNLEEIISNGLDIYMDRVNEIPQVVNTMREIELQSREVEHLLMEAGRTGIMAWSRIGQVDQEFYHPTFHDHDERTAWGLYNAFTYVIQKSPPQYHIRSMNRFRELIFENSQLN